MIHQTKKVFSLLVAVVFLSFLGHIGLPGLFCKDAMGAGVKKKNKGTCKSVSLQDAEEALNKLKAKDVQVIQVAETPIKGICEITIENKGRPDIIYLDTSKKYLIDGHLIDLETTRSLKVVNLQKMKDKKRVDLSKVPLKEALFLGEASASKKVIIFTDPDCSFCSDLHTTAKQIIAKRKDIAFYLKFNPLAFHKDAYWKSKSIVCSKSLQMLDDNFAKKEIAKTECATDEVDNSMKLAASLGFSGTPTLVLPDGRVREGALPESELIQLIDGKM